MSLCMDRGCVFLAHHTGHHSWWGTRSTQEQKDRRKAQAMSKTKSSSAITMGDDWWIVRGNWLPYGVKIAGPFTTRDDALTARAAVEAFAGGETFYVDSTKSAILV